MKRFFSLMLIALVSCAMMVSCDKEESNTNNNQGGNGGNGGNGGGQQVADGIKVTFGGETWTAGFMQNQWVTEYEQAVYSAYKNADLATTPEDQITQEMLFPATDGWVYPSTTAEQDYLCNYYKEKALDISSAFGQPDGTVIAGDYFWYPIEGYEDVMMTVSAADFDAATLLIKDMTVNVPLWKTEAFLGEAQDDTTYPEVVEFHNVQLTVASSSAKTPVKKLIRK